MQPRPGAPSPLIRVALATALTAMGAVLVVAGALALVAPRPPQADATRSPFPSTAAGAPTASPTTPPSPSPAVSPTPAGDPVLIGAGDIARCDGSGDEATAGLLERTPGIVFTLGDNVYDSGSAAQLRDCYGPSWGRLKDRTGFAVAGNHDYLTDDGAPFREYFGRAAVRDGVTWFAEDVGAWRVIVLDANCGEPRGGCGPDSPQLDWLRDDLAASDARCTLALWHQPRFSSGQHGDEPAVGSFWDALHAAGADLVLNGHDHDYERFAPQDPKGEPDPARGITQIVVGTGGAALRDFGALAPNAVVRSNVAFGVLELTLGPSGWGFRFISTDGSFSDQGRGACH